MTENEAIKTLLGKIMPLNIHNSPFIHKGNQAHEMAIQALKEIQQYRAYKEIFESHFSQDALELLSDEVEFGKWLERGKWIAKRCDEINRELEEYRAIGTVEDIRNTYLLCEVFSSTVRDYTTIGTIEEFKALKEKNIPKKRGIWKSGRTCCPNCERGVVTEDRFCSYCGQAIEIERD